MTPQRIAEIVGPTPLTFDEIAKHCPDRYDVEIAWAICRGVHDGTLSVEWSWKVSAA